MSFAAKMSKFMPVEVYPLVGAVTVGCCLSVYALNHHIKYNPDVNTKLSGAQHSWERFEKPTDVSPHFHFLEGTKVKLFAHNCLGSFLSFRVFRQTIAKENLFALTPNCMENNKHLMQQKTLFSTLVLRKRANQQKTKCKTGKNCKRVMFCKVGTMNMCRVVNGLWQTSGGWGDIDSKLAVSAMAQCAKNDLASFDGADHYGPSEELMGSLRRVASDHQLVLCSKWCPRPANYSLEDVERAVKKSVSRMGEVHLIAFHWWDYGAWAGEKKRHDYVFTFFTFSFSECCGALHHLNELRSRGMFSNLGLTNFNTVSLRRLLEEERLPIVSNQVSFSVLDQRPLKGMCQLCEKHNVKLLTCMESNSMFLLIKSITMFVFFQTVLFSAGSSLIGIWVSLFQRSKLCRTRNIQSGSCFLLDRGPSFSHSCNF
jgi:diketogulonate reductase-like aldo/keto reductase